MKAKILIQKDTSYRDILSQFIGFLIVLLPLNIVVAQDTTLTEIELSVITKGQHNLSALANNFECFHCGSKMVYDNPFFHLAVYSGVTSKILVNKKFEAETGIFMEERSYSGGNNTLANLVIYPKIKLSFSDTLFINKKKVTYYISGGDFWNEDINDILRIYNVDYHCLQTNLRFKKFELGFLTIGDLSRNVGLDLHQLYKFSLGYIHKGFRNISAISINELLTPPSGHHLTSSDLNFSNFTKKNVSKNLSFVAQIELRKSTGFPISLAIGTKLLYVLDKFKMSTAIRYYDSQFNFGYNGALPKYYESTSYVGSQLYPLRNYYRNFSQWALYSHLRNGDLIGTELTLNWVSNENKKIGIFCDVDVNYIYDITHHTHYLFPIYNMGIQMNFLKNFKGRISATNKHMDLRQEYQTFAISKIPFVALGFNLELDSFKWTIK